MGRFLPGLLKRNQCPRLAPAKRRARRSLIVERLEDRRLLEAGGLDLLSVLYVDADAPGAHTGTSWLDALSNLQDAIAAAIGNRAIQEIRVAEGTYRPDQGGGYVAGDRLASFQLLRGVAIRGGYAGLGATDPDARDVAAYPTVLTGDLRGDDATAGNEENSCHVVYAPNGADATAVLDGVTVTAGNTTRSDVSYGGLAGAGFYTYTGSPTVVNCIFHGNVAGGAHEADGAGFWNYSGSPTVADCQFLDNTASNDGGGMYNYAGNPTITHCTFRGNVARGNYDPGGAGFWNYEGNPVVTNCVFDANLAAGDGAGMFNYSGNPQVTNCLFTNNSAPAGAALWNYEGSPRVTNCTISGNLGSQGAGMWNYDGTPTIANSILWGNGSAESAQISSYAGQVSIRHSCIENRAASGDGNIAADPWFADVVGGNYRLLQNSPCVDTGDNAAVPAGVAVDLEGNPRIMDGTVNMGAYEQPVVVPIDRLTISDVASPQRAEAPFVVTLAAVDRQGRPVANFCGPVELSGWVKTANNATLVISEVDTSPNDRIEFTNVSGRDLDISGWQVITYDRLSKTAPRPAFTIPAGTICPKDGVFVVREHGKKPGAYPTFATGKEIAWQPNKATGVLLRDANGQVVDFMAAAALDPAQITKPAPIGPDVWQGGAIASQPDSSLTYQRIGSADHNNAADWVVAAPSLGQWNTGLNFPPAEIQVPIEPTTVTFAHGVWTGQVTVLTETARMFLRADDGNGHRAESNTFDVHEKLSEIRGTVWRDEDGNGKREAGEPGVGGWQLYLDLNQNGRQDADEAGTTTDLAGKYVFRNVPDGVYRVAQVIVPGWMQTFPRFDPGPLTRINLGPDGAQANREAHSPAISADGRFVAFISSATNLVPGDPSAHSDVFVYDRLTGAMELASPTLDGGEADGSPMYVSLSSDGRFVVFTSYATNLAPGDSNAMPDIFVFDRKTRTTERVSVASDGTQGDWISESAAISADGRYVAFESLSRNLVPGDTNGYQDIFVHDRKTSTTERVSVGVAGAETNGHSHDPAISADGRYVTFSSSATNLVPGDTNSQGDIFVYDRKTGVTERVSVASDGAQADRSSMQPAISFDGRWVVFESVATNLVAGDTNKERDIFLHDRQTGQTERISVGAGGAQANGMCMLATVSADGRFVTFDSQATNLVPGDTNGKIDVFLYDRQFGTLRRLSVAATGAEGNGTSGPVAMSADGAWAVFGTEASNLVPGDTNGCPDILLCRLDYSSLMRGQTVAIVAGQTIENVDFGNRPPIFVGGTPQATWSSAPRATSGSADFAGNTQRPSFYRAVRAVPRRAAHENNWTLAVDRVLEARDTEAADWEEALAARFL